MKKVHRWLNDQLWKLMGWFGLEGEDLNFRQSIIMLVMIVIFALSMIFLSRFMLVKERFPSPDGETMLVIQSENSGSHYFPTPGFNIRSGTFGHYSLRSYKGRFLNLYWAPDSTKYLVFYSDEGQTNIDFCRMDGHAGYKLTDLSDEVQAAEQAQSRTVPLPKAIHYKFIQWAEDSSAAKFSYYFADTAGTAYTGTFWYDFSLHQPDSNMPLWFNPEWLNPE